MCFNFKVTFNMQPVVPAITSGSRTNRSRITNGTRLLAGVDGRSATARRFRDLIVDLVAEVGDGLSTSEFGLIRQAAAMTLHAELLQASIVRGEAVSADELIRLSSEARRILASLRRRGPAKSRSGVAEYLNSLPPEPFDENAA